MKNKQTKKFQFSKETITKFKALNAQEIKGGTIPTDPHMTAAPDENNVCFAIK
ncbi:hypothetical protein H2O64_08590 [Kordia sp. YSTF-M3]|uniref:Natural product n=1 Tax=Kordia aestuariivivens TaxID=2759037 RepID=A0ABR7Q847_9FLAO|nr:hypothetical protein [Kordia aestuariivivens]MBC8754725.1 hypothetical protein [Kordia aestuariivivens]